LQKEGSMSDLVQFDRRALLKTTTGLLTGLVVAGSPLSAIAGGRAWAMDLASLTSAEGSTLLTMARTIAPHDKLDDAAYAIVVQRIDGDASKDAQVHKLVKDGIAALGDSFASRCESERVEALNKIEPSEFFQAMRIKTIQVLYATPLTYAYFGYEGEAFSKGGYLLRGFNDLRWLPEVPSDDGGPVPIGS
jgi:hypothetical protein